MPSNSSENITVSQRLFQPLTDIWPNVTTSMACPRLPDDAFIRLGVSRVLSQAKSGRDFLQSHAEAGASDPITVSHFFETIKSPRREIVCAEVNQLLCSAVGLRCPDPFADFEDLLNFDIYAGDGHYIKASAHEEPIDGEKRPVGHFYILNLRSRALQHFALGLTDKETDRKGEHDMHAIKRRGLAALRFGATKGRQIMIVWDKAGIDFSLWSKAKESGVYFLSREKDNMTLETVRQLPFDPDSEYNEGVLSDETVLSAHGVVLRRIVYYDCVDDLEYTYLTSNLKLPPGLLVLLYKRRWDIEKVFDENKNRFQESKAWAKSPTAKLVQAHLICVTHNLCLLMEERLDTKEQIRNEPEIVRRAQRQAVLAAKLALKQQKLPFIYRVVDRLTQRGVKLLRWIRNHLYAARHWDIAIGMLRNAYTRL
jgi:Transposase DDE domain